MSHLPKGLHSLLYVLTGKCNLCDSDWVFSFLLCILLFGVGLLESVLDHLELCQESRLWLQRMCSVRANDVMHFFRKRVSRPRCWSSIPGARAVFLMLEHCSWCCWPPGRSQCCAASPAGGSLVTNSFVLSIIMVIFRSLSTDSNCWFSISLTYSLSSGWWDSSCP